jgi:carboxy-cis,cis-muconate cyclase
MVKHHLMIGTWTPPGVIITVAFDTETLKLELVKKTVIPEDEPISWMAFDVRTRRPQPQSNSMAYHK